jgi:hypothetical protein
MKLTVIRQQKELESLQNVVCLLLLRGYVKLSLYKSAEYKILAINK